MSRRALLALLLACATLAAQDGQPTVDSLRKRAGELKERLLVIERATAAEHEEKQRQESARNSANDRRETARRDYDSGEGLPAETVDERIAALEAQMRSLQANQDATARQLAETEKELINVADEEDKVAARLKDARQRDVNPDAARTELWDKVEAELPPAYARLKTAIRSRAQTLRELQAAQSATMTEYVKALAMHRRENLFLRSDDRLTWAKTRETIADLQHAPAWIDRERGAVTAYFSDPTLQSGVLTWAGAATALAVLVWFLGRGMRRRSILMEQQRTASGDNARHAIHTVYRFGRRGIHLLLLFLVPWSAAAMLPGLSPEVESFLRGIAQLGAAYYLAWSVYRELLRPDAPEQAILQVDPEVRRQIGLAIFILLVASVPARLLILTLHFAGYANSIAFLLLELLRLLGASVALSGIIFRKRIFTALLPRADAAWARLVRGLARFARPFLRLLAPLLLVLEALRYEALAELVGSFSLALLAVIIAGTLGYQVLKSLVLQWVQRQYADDSDSEPADASRGALLFVLRVTVFLVGLRLVPVLAGIPLAEFRESLQVGFPFTGEDSGITLWNIGAAIVTGLIVWFGTLHTKALLQYQVLARTSIDGATQYTIATLFGYVVLTLGLVVALRQVADLSALGTIVAALSVGIGFGMQDIVSNFISGIILLFERPIRVGDTIEVGANQGRVRTINIRATTVQTLDNVFILVPNRSLISNEVVNYGYSDPKVRLSIPVGVSYSSEPEQVRDVLLQVAEENSSVLRHPVPQVQFLAFADSSLNFRLLAWVQRADQRQRITSDLNFAIFAAFREAGIQIPFPQRDVHIRSADGLAPRALPDPAPDPEPDA